MVSYKCVHQTDQYLDLSDHFVDLTGHDVDLSEIFLILMAFLDSFSNKLLISNLIFYHSKLTKQEAYGPHHSPEKQCIGWTV